MSNPIRVYSVVGGFIVYEFVAELALHFFVMMMIPLSCFILYRRCMDTKTTILFAIANFAALFLTMSFPANISGNIHFDLKFIPLFIVFFYIRPAIGILFVVFIILFKSLVNPSEVLFLLLNYGIASVIFIIMSTFYKRFSFMQKIIFGACFYIPITLTRYLAIVRSGDTDEILNLIWFSIMSAITLTMVIYLIELNNIQLSMMVQLQNSDKMNAISQLAASVAHEIRNPMTSVRGFLQLIKSDNNLTEEQGMFISISLEELKRTDQIINDFLSLARPETKSNELISLTKTIEEVFSFMKPYANISNVLIEYDIEQDLFILGNSHEMKQVLINITKNGIEAMQSGGSLTIKVYQSDGEGVVDIIDQGIGLSEQQLTQLGQPYYSTKTKGTGLGLMISFDIIKRMNGEYKIKSKERCGTTFSLLFPLVPAKDYRGISTKIS